MRVLPLEGEELCQAWKHDHGNLEGVERKLGSQDNKGDTVMSFGYFKKNNFLINFFPSETITLSLIFYYAGDHRLPQPCREDWPSKLVSCFALYHIFYELMTLG